MVTIVRVRKVGPVQVSNVIVSASGGSSDRWPGESFDDLSDDRLFRLLMTCSVTFKGTGSAPIGTDDTFWIDLVGPDQVGSDTEALIWRRYSDAPTDVPTNAEGDEFMDGEFSFYSAYASKALSGFLLPPGFALSLACFGPVADYLQMEAMVALSPDPGDLLPFVGARTGGIAGPQY